MNIDSIRLAFEQKLDKYRIYDFNVGSNEEYISSLMESLLATTSFEILAKKLNFRI